MVSYGLPFIKMVLIGAGRGEMEVEVQTEQQQRATDAVQESSLQLGILLQSLMNYPAVIIPLQVLQTVHEYGPSSSSSSMSMAPSLQSCIC